MRFRGSQGVSADTKRSQGHFRGSSCHLRGFQEVSEASKGSDMVSGSLMSVCVGFRGYQENLWAFQRVPGDFRRSLENSEAFKVISSSSQVVLGCFMILRVASWVSGAFQGVSRRVAEGLMGVQVSSRGFQEMSGTF